MTPPDVRFYRFIDTARSPQRADRSAIGTLPMRAVRYCEAVCSATAFGWWLFCPVDCWVCTYGTGMFWSVDGDKWRRCPMPAISRDFGSMGCQSTCRAGRAVSPPFFLPPSMSMVVFYRSSLE